DEIGPTVLLGDVVDVNQVGVVHAGDGLCLGAEARQLVGAGVRSGQDHLEGHESFEGGLPRLVNHPHAAASQFAEDLIAADSGRHRGGGGRRRRGGHGGGGGGGGGRAGEGFRLVAADRTDRPSADERRPTVPGHFPTVSVGANK